MKIREPTGAIVCLADHETGVPHAMACMSMKEGEGDRCELKIAQKLIATLPDLNHKLVTADALHCQAATAQAIVAQGGDYLLQVKDNQKTVCALAEAGMAQAFFARFEKEHGRETPPPDRPKKRRPAGCPLPACANRPSCTPATQARKRKPPHGRRLLPQQSVSRFQNTGTVVTNRSRSLGGVEIRNHWRKDACLFEDKTRSRKPHIVGNLILLRNLVLFSLRNITKRMSPCPRL